ncbi:hypothetical protein HOC13_01085 [Candidatus Woesearchaeota archaeon]|jgi:hypothetical protein|nr:hypothetical protein [Candidatus Woesearchaeota archaeon]
MPIKAKDYFVQERVLSMPAKEYLPKHKKTEIKQAELRQVEIYQNISDGIWNLPVSILRATKGFQGKGFHLELLSIGPKQSLNPISRFYDSLKEEGFFEPTSTPSYAAGFSDYYNPGFQLNLMCSSSSEHSQESHNLFLDKGMGKTLSEPSLSEKLDNLVGFDLKSEDFPRFSLMFSPENKKPVLELIVPNSMISQHKSLFLDKTSILIEQTILPLAQVDYAGYRNALERILS